MVVFLILIHKLGIIAVAKGMVDIIGMNENRTAGQILESYMITSHGELQNFL